MSRRPRSIRVSSGVEASEYQPHERNVGRGSPGPDRARRQGARLLGDGRPPHRTRQGQHGLRLHSDRDFFIRLGRDVAWARRPLSGIDDSPPPPYRDTKLSARHRRTRPRYAGASDLWRALVPAGRHSPPDLCLRHRNVARSRRRLCRRKGQYRDHAYHRRVLRISLGAACDRDFGRAWCRHRQFHRVPHGGVRAADHPRCRERHHRRAEYGFRRGGAGIRRRPLHHHARAHARQCIRVDFCLRDRPHLGVDDPGGGPVIPGPRHQTTGAGMGFDAQHAAHRDLHQSMGGRIARRHDFRGVDLLQPAQRRNAQRHGHPELTPLMQRDAGEIIYDGMSVGHALSLRELRRCMQMVFQDSYASLNPRLTIEESIAFGPKVHGMADMAARALARELLGKVGLRPETFANRYPHEISGGQRQRVNIARALALSPRLVILDEAVSALDKSVEAQVLNLLVDLKREFGLTYLFISHDLNVVRYISDRVLVMYLGEVVELGPVDRVWDAPAHPYTRALLAGMPSSAPDKRPRPPPISGDPPNPIDPPGGCRFHTRCPFAEPLCANATPKLTALDTMGHQAVCYMAIPGSGHSRAPATS